MRMRWVIIEEPTGLKARLVVQGFTDPDLAYLRRESPTASRRARQLYFALCASLGLHIHKGDVASAFLQEDAGALERYVLCEPVKELAEALGVPVGQAARLRKAVYGLVNAPRQWWNDIRSKMSKLGWNESSIEPCVWKLVDPHGQVVGLCVVHVDDFLIGLDEQSVYAKNKLQELKGLYQWGSWEDKDFQVCGVRV